MVPLLNQISVKLDKVLVHLFPEEEFSAAAGNDTHEIPTLPLVDVEAEKTCELFIKDNRNKKLLVRILVMAPLSFSLIATVEFSNLGFLFSGPILINIWELHGQERYRASHNEEDYFKQARLYLQLYGEKQGRIHDCEKGIQILKALSRRYRYVPTCLRKQPSNRNREKYFLTLTNSFFL